MMWCDVIIWCVQMCQFMKTFKNFKARSLTKRMLKMIRPLWLGRCFFSLLVRLFNFETGRFVSLNINLVDDSEKLPASGLSATTCHRGILINLSHIIISNEWIWEEGKREREREKGIQEINDVWCRSDTIRYNVVLRLYCKTGHYHSISKCAPCTAHTPLNRIRYQSVFGYNFNTLPEFLAYNLNMGLKIAKSLKTTPTNKVTEMCATYIQRALLYFHFRMRKQNLEK